MGLFIVLTVLVFTFFFLFGFFVGYNKGFDQGVDYSVDRSVAEMQKMFEKNGLGKIFIEILKKELGSNE